MAQRSTAEDHPVRTIVTVPVTIALVGIALSALFVAGWHSTAAVLFVLVVFLWPVLALGVLAVRRRL
jgi:hypothetical protein